MCGICCIFNSAKSAAEVRSLVLRLSKCLRHRGPDWSGICVYAGPQEQGGSRVLTSHEDESKGNGGSSSNDSAQNGTSLVTSCLAHERLAIIDPDSGSQPLVHSYTVPNLPGQTFELTLSTNGEIYNHLELRETVDYPFITFSDCEVILPLFKAAFMEPDLAKSHRMIIDVINSLRGMFAFAIYDSRTGRFLAVRDHMGICPLYLGFDRHDGAVWFSSEAKAIQEECFEFIEFPNGHFFDSAACAPPASALVDCEGSRGFHPSSKHQCLRRWYTPIWRSVDGAGADVAMLASWTEEGRSGVALARTLLSLRNSLIRAVERRMMADVPW